MLSTYDLIYGIAQLAAVFLSIIAGIIALSMYRLTHRHGVLKAWKFLIIALVLFTAVEVIGALRSFGIAVGWPHYQYMTHVLTSFILAGMIVSLVTQINVNRGWYK